jgi:hypothetical protein
MLNYGYVVAGENLCVLGDGDNPYTRRVVFAALHGHYILL